MRQQGDARVQRATWFASRPWQVKFLDLFVHALEVFFANKPSAITRIDFMSTSQHKPPE
jgi:hypothetical protein